jgi:hypothetical protein
MKAIENLQFYQNETRAWREKKSKAQEHRSRRSSIVVKPVNGRLRKAGAKVDWTFPSDRKNKTKIILSG